MHPILLQFKLPWLGTNVMVPSYGLCLATAFLVAIHLGFERAIKRGHDPELTGNFCAVLIVSSMVGARATFVWLEWDRFQHMPLQALMLWRGGLVFYGGLIGAIVGCVAFVLWQKLDPWEWADTAAPSVCIGHAIGRFGCFLNGCCYGYPTSSPLGICFPHGPRDMLPRHPTQLYEIAGLLVLAIILTRFYAQPRRMGSVAILYVTLYAPLRYVVECYRGDDRGDTFFGLWSISQSISVGMALLVLALLVLRGKGKPAWPSEPGPAPIAAPSGPSGAA